MKDNRWLLTPWSAISSDHLRCSSRMVDWRCVTKQLCVQLLQTERSCGAPPCHVRHHICSCCYLAAQVKGHLGSTLLTPKADGDVQKVWDVVSENFCVDLLRKGDLKFSTSGHSTEPPNCSEQCFGTVFANWKRSRETKVALGDVITGSATHINWHLSIVMYSYDPRVQ